MDIEPYLQQQRDRIERELERLIPTQHGPCQHLFEAARYSLLGGGKRLRPILAIATAEMLGKNRDHVLTPACCLELIHTYSLIHDDLPCMDDDDFRRGKPSLHKAYPEGHAVLTGDYLLTHAFEVLANLPYLTSHKKVALISILATRAGGSGMIAGQVMDLAAEGKEMDSKALELMHLKKTGALITASVEFGAIIAEAAPSEMELLRSFSHDIGLAFQIVDDILDLTASEKKHGKVVASDVINGKTTYATLLGIADARALANQWYCSALRHLQDLPYDTTRLQVLANRLVHRTA